MELKVTKETKQPLLKRVHVQAELAFAGKATPSNVDVAKAVAERMATKADAVAVRHIYTDFGKNAAAVEAYVYESKDLLDKTEAKHKVKVPKPAPGAAPATPAPAAPAPAAPPAHAAPAAPKAAPAK
jgi:ribosomal protein S24E